MTESDALGMAADSLNSGDWWMGYNDLDDDGIFDWVFGSSSLPLPWRPSESPTKGECGVIDSSARWWQSKECSDMRDFICEAP